jgi:precorrin-2 dehydrogenase / sirohydrochlorin ferrochelatase
MKTTNPYYPLFINLAARKCTVVGGGQVASRKVNSLLKSGAKVVVISPVFNTGLTNLIEEKKIRALNRQYQKGDLKNSFLAFAATDNSRVNCEVAREARETGIPVNVANDALSSDFIVPSSLHRGSISVAFSTSGKSPALARKVRARLEAEFGEEYDALATLVEEIRQELKGSLIKVRNDEWQKALDLDLLVALLKKGEKEKASEALRRNLGIK